MPQLLPLDHVQVRIFEHTEADDYTDGRKDERADVLARLEALRAVAVKAGMIGAEHAYEVAISQIKAGIQSIVKPLQ